MPAPELERNVSARWDARFDLVLAAGITVLTQRDVWVQAGVGSAARVAIAALMLVACGSLAWRRRSPLLSCFLIAVALAAQAAISGVDFRSLGTALAIILALYSAGAYLDLSRAGLAVVLVAIGLGARELRDFGAFKRDPWNEAFFFLLVLSISGLGVAIRHRRRAQHLRSLAGMLQQEGAAEARMAVVEERERIARELHDVVAHGVSAVVIQAEAAEELLASSPDRARESLWTIQRLGREALTEMRQALGILRGGEEEHSRAPQPTLSDLPALIARNRESGLAVRLHVLGVPRPLPPGLQVSAYRVVQEGLTNVRRHAAGASAGVSVHYRPGALEIEIVDDGPGASARNNSGLGLIGMRERVTFFGGEFSAGTRSDGGFVVSATFPTAVPATQ
jgi:signal transduction histidine kinase